MTGIVKINEAQFAEYLAAGVALADAKERLRKARKEIDDTVLTPILQLIVNPQFVSARVTTITDDGYAIVHKYEHRDQRQYEELG